MPSVMTPMHATTVCAMQHGPQALEWPFWNAHTKAPCKHQGSSHALGWDEAQALPALPPQLSEG